MWDDNQPVNTINPLVKRQGSFEVASLGTPSEAFAWPIHQLSEHKFVVNRRLCTKLTARSLFGIEEDTRGDNLIVDSVYVDALVVMETWNNEGDN